MIKPFILNNALKRACVVADNLRKATFTSSFLASSSLVAKELKLKKYGQVDSSVDLFHSNLDERLKTMQSNDLLVKLVASPINPADINFIKGNYDNLPDNLPKILGNEGLFEVVECRGEFKRGDWVISSDLDWGNWRSHAIAPISSFIKLPNNLNKHSLATIQVNPCTAYRMLNDFVQLKENDTIIQNGANSGVGQSIIQFGKQMKLNVINIVRKRENATAHRKLCEYLESLGAKYIFTEDELMNGLANSRANLWSSIARPKLALNCVGGQATTNMIRVLDRRSTLVTYGRMSGQPVTTSAENFIFNDLTCKGFWITGWRRENPQAYKSMLDSIVQMMASDSFVAPDCVEYKIEDYKLALAKAQEPYTNTKILLTS